MEISLKKIIFMQDISNAKLMEFKKLIDRGAELKRMKLFIEKILSLTLFMVGVESVSQSL